jgi:radical SAM protein with 4Fe4S-binding SPASM domain
MTDAGGQRSQNIEKNNARQENDILYNSIVEDWFFDTWKKNYKGKINRQKIEIIINSECNLGCNYCYYFRNEDHLFPKELRNSEVILKNVEKILDWIIKKEFYPKGIDLFSGDLFAQELGFQVLELFYKKFKDKPNYKNTFYVMVPTNFTFILDKDLAKRVQDIVDRLRKIGIRIGLSASFDGKYMEENRPFRKDLDFKLSNMERDDDYYDRAFKFIKKNSFGLHPMVYSKNIDKWKKNFQWFQRMMKKHGISWNRIYLLEVRNQEWTKEDIQHLYDFVKFLIHWTNAKFGNDRIGLIEFLTNGEKGFNILSSIAGRNGRGISCSVQNTFFVRAADLSIPGCHRLSYKNLLSGYMEEESGEITGKIKTKNAEFGISTIFYNYKNSPYCSTCDIKNICIGGCLGSQYESMNDPFIPIPTVCAAEHAKVRAIVEGWTEIGVFNDIMSSMGLDEDQKREVMDIKKSI